MGQSDEWGISDRSILVFKTKCCGRLFLLFAFFPYFSQETATFSPKGNTTSNFLKNRVVIFDSFVQTGTLLSPSFPPLSACIAGLWLNHLFHRSVIIHFLGGFLLVVFRDKEGD